MESTKRDGKYTKEIKDFLLHPPDGSASDLLYIICCMNGGGRIVYEVSNEFYNKTVEPSGWNVLYLNQNNTTYEKYTSQVLWPWSDF